MANNSGPNYEVLYSALGGGTLRKKKEAHVLAPLSKHLSVEAALHTGACQQRLIRMMRMATDLELRLMLAENKLARIVFEAQRE